MRGVELGHPVLDHGQHPGELWFINKENAQISVNIEAEYAKARVGSVCLRRRGARKPSSIFTAIPLMGWKSYSICKLHIPLRETSLISSQAWNVHFSSSNWCTRCQIELILLGGEARKQGQRRFWEVPEDDQVGLCARNVPAQVRDRQKKQRSCRKGSRTT